MSDDDDIDSVLRGVAAAPPLGARAPSASLLGATIGNYQVTRLLGEGGMGAVYLGEHPLIGKQVAIKVLHRHLAQEEEVVTRFFTEARAVNDIRHENIVDVMDFGVSGERAYIIMELLSGESLHQRLGRGNLSHQEIVRILSQAAGALAAAHAKGVIHRDLKPENIFLSARGQVVKLLDFGIAKLTKDQSAWRTRTGALIGTPLYMSPEQCAGRRNIDARSDIYSLGVVLFEMLSGRVPFNGTGLADVLRGHMNEPPPPLPPSPLAAIALKCLAKDPAARHSSVGELRAALESPVHRTTLSASVGEVRAAPSPARRMWMVLIGGLAVAAGIALLALTHRAPSPPMAPPIAVASPAPAAVPIAAVPDLAAPAQMAEPPKKKHHTRPTQKPVQKPPSEKPANEPLDDKLL